MKIKYLIAVPTIVASIAFITTSCDRNRPQRNPNRTNSSENVVHPNYNLNPNHNPNQNPSKQPVPSSPVAYAYSNDNTNPNNDYSNRNHLSNNNGTGSQSNTYQDMTSQNRGNGSSYINKYSNGSTNGSQGLTTYGNNNQKGMMSMPTTGGNNSCSTMDFSVFEESDEENVYGQYGFTRGDIKSLFTGKYDPKAEHTISGNVIKTIRVQFPDGNCYLIAVVSTSQGNVLANLGPVWFMDENNFSLNEGDQIDLSGSVIRMNGRYIVIASQIKKNGQALMLRNQGNPQWGQPKSQKGTNTTSKY